MSKSTVALHRLRTFNLFLFALMPAALLISRGTAEVCMAVIGLSFLADTIIQKGWYRFRDPLFATLLITWLILNLLISPLALDPALSYGRSLPWFRFIVFFAATTLWLVQSRADLKVIAVLWGATLGLAMIDGFVQLVSGIGLSGRAIDGGVRLTGPLDRPNIGMFAARIGFPLVTAWLLIAGTSQSWLGDWKLRLAIFAYSLLTLMFILLTGERSASILTVLAVLTIIALAIVTGSRYRWISLSALVMVSICVALILEISTRIRARAESTLSTILDFWSSVYGELIALGYRIWTVYPIEGAGLRNYVTACERIFSNDLVYGCHPHPHNIYVEWLSESGTIGFLCFLAFVFLIVRQVMRPLFLSPHIKMTGLVLVGCLIVTLFPLAISQSFFSNWPAMLMWCSLALAVCTAKCACAVEGQKAQS